MMKSLAVALLATAVIGGAAINRAEAQVARPGSAIIPADETVLSVRWVCSQSRCDWVPIAVFHPRPSYTLNWDPPRTPGCFWEKRRSGRWREVCPR